MYFRFWGVGVELGGREKLLWAMLLLEEALKNSSLFTEEAVDEWKGYLL